VLAGFTQTDAENAFVNGIAGVTAWLLEPLKLSA
jgi:hypothetical protein